ncbi:hypothetical protein D5S17_28565 [Pseudonocardiaceae bacterium YIM PH 21723]|nr:hypothetical protein D5S17_28565 [Pseudonocardiaceae bacterium YIM PH 21723]
MVYIGIRELSLMVLRWIAGRNQLSVPSALTSWDGQWFLNIAKFGYDGVSPNLVDAFGKRNPDTPMAFFPGYPAMVNLLNRLPGVGLVSAAFAVSLVSGIVCAYAISRLARQVAPVTGLDDAGRPLNAQRLGLIMVALFAASPMAIVLSMAYSESLFCALAAWALVGVLERRWLLAGVMTLGAGLVRPTVGALIVVVGLAALLAIIGRRDGWRPWAAGLLAPLGLIGYLLWVGRRSGRLDGWFVLQRDGWNSRFDFGAETWKFSLDVLASGRSVLETVTVGILIVAVVLMVIGWRQGVPWPLLAYAAGVFLMDVGSNGLMNSKARLLLPAFTLVIPVAVALARKRQQTVLLVLAAVAVASAWFGTYSIAAWGYAI